MVSINRASWSSDSRERTMKWLDRILALIAIVVFYHWFWSPSDFVSESSFLSDQKKCARQSGVVVVNLLDFLGYNLFQIAFARRIADELCWEIVYRTMWKTEFGKEEEGCFGALTEPSETIKQDLGINHTLWRALNDKTTPITEHSEQGNEIVKQWSKELSLENKAWRCIAGHCNFEHSHMQRVLEHIRIFEDIRVVYLEDFFVYGSWLESLQTKVQKWLTPTCCKTQLPPNAIVIHASNTESDDKLNAAKLSVDAYDALFAQYALHGRPVVILCPNSETKSSAIVSALKSKFAAKVLVESSESQTLCALSRAPTLIMASGDILSLMAGVLSTSSEIHVPFADSGLGWGIVMPRWKYHIIENGKIKEWNVDHTKINYEKPWN